MSAYAKRRQNLECQVRSRRAAAAGPRASMAVAMQDNGTAVLDGSAVQPLTQPVLHRPAHRVPGRRPDPGIKLGRRVTDRGDRRPEVTYLGETGTEAVAGAVTVSVKGGEVDRP